MGMYSDTSTLSQAGQKMKFMVTIHSVPYIWLAIVSSLHSAKIICG